MAEVLITLSVIGVVASMTIPNFIASQEKIGYCTSLEKFYSVTNQALQKMTTDLGCVGDLVCTGIFANNNVINTAAQQKAGTEIVKYFNVAKDCGGISSGNGCGDYPVNPNYDGSGTPSLGFDVSTGYKFITTDGMVIFMQSYGNNCTADFGQNALDKTCGNIIVDINGKKGPNRQGRDVFQFWITNGKGASIYPVAGFDDGNSPWWNNQHWPGGFCQPARPAGNYCTGRVMEEGWTMNY